jgi:hypothetical protein
MDSGQDWWKSQKASPKGINDFIGTIDLDDDNGFVFDHGIG